MVPDTYGVNSDTRPTRYQCGNSDTARNQLVFLTDYIAVLLSRPNQIPDISTRYQMVATEGLQ